MNKTKPAFIIAVVFLIFISGCAEQQKSWTMVDNVRITWLGHSSVMIEGSKIIYIDPYVLDKEAPVADYIIITHNHPDHCDNTKVEAIQDQDTRIFGTIDCIQKLKGKTNSLGPAEYFSYPDGFRIDRIEAYNTNSTYHPMGSGFGALIHIDNVTIYDSGDTDVIPEMYNLSDKNIDVALLAAGGKYTMDMAQAAEAAKIIRPKYVIPVHYDSDKYGIKDLNTNPKDLVDALKGTSIEPIILKQAV